MVLCYHYFPNILICNFGWTGVDLFFVLSGFLISGKLLPYLDDKKLLIKFYRNRFLRIVPLYFSILIFFFTCWFLFSSSQTLKAFKFYQNNWWNFFLFIQNWTFANTSAEVKTHLLHLWSVAVEEQIYLLFPILVLYIKNKKQIFYIILALCFIILAARTLFSISAIVDNQYNLIFWNTFFRLDAFLSGVAIYFIFYWFPVSSRYIKWSGFICILIIVAKVIISNNAEKNNLFTASIGYTLVAIAYASLLWLTLTQENKFINFITSSNLLRFTGKISYGMYLIHWPLFIAGYAVLNKFFTAFNLPVNTKIVHIANVLVCIPLTYFFSYFSYKYFESYFLKKKVDIN